MVQEITTTSWGSRIMSALWGVIIGFVIIAGTFFLVFWNEGHGLHTAQSLAEAGKVLITVPAAPVDAKNNLHVVFLSGKATTDSELHDKLFGISSKAIRIVRKVEMYQWEQHTETTTQKQTGGSEQETKTYSYKQVWSPKLIDSSEFKDQAGHTNPENMPITSKTEQAEDVKVGDFTLPTDLVSQISGETPIDLAKADLSRLKDKIDKPLKLDDNVIYAGESSNTPKIGDMRITLTEVLPQEVSIIAEQSDESLQPYMAKAGQSVSLLEMGHQTPQEMISNAESANSLMVILLRVGSLILMIIGFALLMRPIVVLADFIPLFGNIVGFGTGAIAFVAGLILWTIATSIAWFAFRPLWAIGLIIIAGGTCYLILSARKRINMKKI